MTTPYLKLCKLSRDELEAARRIRQRRAYRTLAFAVGFAVFLALAIVAGLAARGDSGTWRVPEDRCDVAELNHFYDDNGKPIFEQWIFWEWCNEAERFQIVAWRLHKLDAQHPRRDFARGVWSVFWVDAELFRRIRIGNLRESWSQTDPELIERNVFAKENRRELFHPAAKAGQ